MENIDIDIDIDKEFLENIDIDIDIDKEILENIDIDKISNRLEFGISNRARQPQRTIKLQPKEIEIYDNLINNALCMTPFRTMLKHSTFRDRIQMTADIFEPVALCFIKEEVRESSPLHCTPSSLDEQLSLPVPAPKQGESQSRVTIHNQQLLSHCQKVTSFKTSESVRLDI